MHHRRPRRRPQKVGVALVDVLAGLYAAVGILAALRHRDATGEGQRVEVDLLSSLLAGWSTRRAPTPSPARPAPDGHAHPSIAPYELFPTADGELVLAVGNDRQFPRLCGRSARPELETDPRFAGNAGRVATRRRLRAELEPLLAARAGREWAPGANDAGVPAGR